MLLGWAWRAHLIHESRPRRVPRRVPHRTVAESSLRCAASSAAHSSSIFPRRLHIAASAQCGLSTEGAMQNPFRFSSGSGMHGTTLRVAASGIPRAPSTDSLWSAEQWQMVEGVGREEKLVQISTLTSLRDWIKYARCFASSIFPN